MIAKQSLDCGTPVPLCNYIIDLEQGRNISEPAFKKTIESFKTDMLKVFDEF